MQLFLLCCLCAAVTLTSALDNGLARTPPMGWLSWQRFRCDIDCKDDPDNCISERLYLQIADRMVADGYKDAGYEYVNIDDCWPSKERDPETMRLVPDPVRFPRGIKFIADYVHQKGLKLGIYSDMGRLTCGGYPGSKLTMKTDAETFAEWGIDSLKLDGCYSDPTEFTVSYPIMEWYLNKTGRPMLYSCSWPAYLVNSKVPIDYPRIAKYCNIWRNFDDIDDSWDSVKTIIKFYGDDKWNFSSVAGPGNFNDPDMIIVGNNGLSYSQSQAQMAMWAIMAAPLFLSSDLRTIRADMREIILHKGIIAINQDPLGIMGKRVWQISNIQAWTRPVTPKGSYAIALLNENDGGAGTIVAATFANLGIQATGQMDLTDIFTGKLLGTFTSADTLKIHVDVSSVFFGKLTPK